MVTGKRAPPRDSHGANGGGWDAADMEDDGASGEDDPYEVAAAAAAVATLADSSVTVADLEGGWLNGSPRAGQGAAQTKGHEKDKSKGQATKRSPHSDANTMPDNVMQLLGLAPNSADVAGGGDAAGGGSSTEAGAVEDGGAPAGGARKQKEKGKKRVPQVKEVSTLVFYSRRSRSPP